MVRNGYYIFPEIQGNNNTKMRFSYLIAVHVKRKFLMNIKTGGEIEIFVIGFL